MTEPRKKSVFSEEIVSLERKNQNKNKVVEFEKLKDQRRHS